MLLGAAKYTVSVICVTYADRYAYVKNLLGRLELLGVDKFFLFVNGYSEDELRSFKKWVSENISENLEVRLVVSNVNIGTAKAYKRLLEEIRSCDVDYVWLLDDDNYPEESSLDKLIKLSVEKDLKALSSVRNDRSYMVDLAMGKKDISWKKGAAFGFNIFEYLRRLVFKLLRNRNSQTIDHGEKGYCSIGKAPYGGLWLSNIILKEIELPREDYYIYADDYEFTSRVAEEFGLFLAFESVVFDQEASWNASSGEQKHKYPFQRLADANPDFRVYYSLRNAVFFESCAAKGGWRFIYYLNLFALLTLTFLSVVCSGRDGRVIKIVIRAVADAIRGKLGKNRDYELPQSDSC